MGKNRNKDNADKKVVFTTNPETMEDLFKGIQTDDSPPSDQSEQRVRVKIERKGRAGKTVTLIEGVEGSEDFLEGLLKECKKKCGVGGSLQEEAILLQGDVRNQVVKILLKKGYTDTKKSGG